jgi:FMN phosphatase YigB (HAD superfamily)
LSSSAHTSSPAIFEAAKSGSTPLIKNLLFDLGGVILTISPQRTIEAFAGLAGRETAWVENALGQSGHFHALERGELDDAAFFDVLRDLLLTDASDNALESCWNAMLLDFPIARIRLLERLRRHYRLFLLSNTNAIHARFFNRLLFEACGHSALDNLFERAYYSHLIGLRKPMLEIYEYILQSDDSIKADETLFLDDTLANLEAANPFGIQTHHVQQNDLAQTLAYCGIIVPA